MAHTLTLSDHELAIVCSALVGRRQHYRKHAQEAQSAAMEAAFIKAALIAERIRLRLPHPYGTATPTD